MSQQVRGHVEIQYHSGGAGSPAGARAVCSRIQDRLTADVGCFARRGSTDRHGSPERTKLRIRKRLSILVCKNIFRGSGGSGFHQAFHQTLGNGDVTLGSFAFQYGGDLRLLVVGTPSPAYRDVGCGGIQKHAIPLQSENLLPAQACIKLRKT